MVSYNILLHRRADRTLDNLKPAAQEKLTALLEEVAKMEQPSHHEKAKQLQGQPGMFRVRTGDYRAICELSKPDLLVHRCGNRKHVYDDVDELRSA